MNVRWSVFLAIALLAGFLGSSSPTAVAGWSDPWHVVDRISVSSIGAESNETSGLTSSISRDGRYIAFESWASNLVAGDTNDAKDVYLHDRSSGTTERVSISTSGVEGNDESEAPAVSDDGRFVAFESWASNLVPNDTNDSRDVFVHDRYAGTTERISLASDGTEGNRDSRRPSISADGRYVAFHSAAWTLVSDDSTYEIDVFVRDRVLGTTERVSVSSSGVAGDDFSGSPSISDDGRFVAFYSSALNLVADDGGPLSVFVRDRALGTTERVSVSSSGEAGNNGSEEPSISGDGRYVAFHSLASNFAVDDTNGDMDIFVHDRQLGTTERVSISSGGAEANQASRSPSISDDGRFVTFNSWASNLTADDTNDEVDIFVHDRELGTTERVSRTSSGAPVNGSSSAASISGNGRYVLLLSGASNLVPNDTNGTGDTFIAQRSGFFDVDGLVFESDIDWLATEAITKGCNPPYNDMFCPNDPVTRGQMAAFLVRALGLTEPGPGGLFIDDNGSVFEASIEQLATAGITKGCNPPDNDMFCPNDPVTRGQMAAFLVRALGYTDHVGGNLFVDDDGSIFEANIERLATAGVTRGCNPPLNDHFCPHSSVTRGQMAAFLHRALGT